MNDLSDAAAPEAVETETTDLAPDSSPIPASTLAEETRADGMRAEETGAEETGAEETGAEDMGAEDAEAAEKASARFADLGLSEAILRAVEEAGYRTPTPIQEQAIPVVLMGRDVLGCAQTGTGKTAGFTLPMLDILASGRAKARMPRSLILEPTRELALQVAENFVKYGKHLSLTHALLIGGESMEEQKAVLNQGVDVLIATPGRLLDLFDRGRILLADCKVLVIDEADRMLDMGFIPDVERIVSLLPRMRQTLFFSATMAPEIRRLADAFLSNPKEITVTRPASVATTITTGLCWVQEHDKREALRRLIRSEDVQNALIFCNRKVDVDILYRSLKKHHFSVGALHGDMDQSQRFATLSAFKAGDIRLLVCSDVAARGLDIGGLSHVFNFDVPFHSEDYVHRIGRTGRAGREGHAYSIATPDDARNVEAIEKLTGARIPRMQVPGLDPVSDEEIAAALVAPKRGRGRSSSSSSSSKPDRGGRSSGSRSGAERSSAERSGAERSSAERSGAERSGAGRGEPAPRRDEAERRDTPDRREAERREAKPRGEAPRNEPPRREDPAPPRRDRDRRDDLGPAVLGFGDAVPAFMLIPLPRSRRETPPEAEAA